MIRMALVLLLTACAELPICPQVEAIAMRNNSGTKYYILSEPNLAAFWERAQKLAKEECKP